MSNSNTPERRCVIEIDGERCSFCEFCVRCCPTQAFRIEQNEDQIRLYFTPGASPACADGEDCVSVCPEDAIRFVEGAQPPTGEILAAQSELLACSYCGARFAPLHKLQALSGRTRNEPIREHCPVCRRKHLVVQFIEQRLLPGAKAEYRSGTDIIRRAGYGPHSTDLED